MNPMYLGTCVLACLLLRKVVLTVCMLSTIVVWVYRWAAMRYRSSPVI